MHHRSTLLTFCACLTLAVPAVPPASAQTAGSATEGPATLRWTIDGVERQALVFSPSLAAAGGKVPLVLAFHGHGGSMQSAARTMAFHRIWPEALVVYPQGLPTVSPVDPLGRQPGWQRNAGDLGGRDLKFVDAMLASLRAKYPVDERRIYATGFSNGAFFTYLLWSARGGTFAAFAPCAGRIWDTLHLSEPKPLLQVAGEEDRLVKYSDQLQTIATVRALDGATGAGASCGEGCTRYPSTKHAPVETIIHPGGHVYPPWVSARIVEFLKMQTLGQ